MSNSKKLAAFVPSVGSGVAFPATQSPSTNPNTLDDYEEGTWTPVQGAGCTVVGTFSFTNAKYTKIGRQVTVYAQLQSSTSIAVSAGGILVTGVPFAVNGFGSGVAMNVNLSTTTSCLVTTSSVTSGAIAATTVIYMQATYDV